MLKIPVFSTTIDIFKETFCDIKRYSFLAWLWLLITGACYFFLFDIFEILINSGELGFSNNNIPLKLLFFSLALLLISILAGMFLISNFLRSSMENRTVLSVGGKDFLFIFVVIALVLTTIIILAISIFVIGGMASLLFGAIFDIDPELENASEMWGFMVVIGIAIGISLFIALYIGTRLSLIIPDIYAKNPVGILECWKKTKGNFLRLFAISFLVGLPFIIPGLLMPTIYYDDITGNAIAGHNAWAYSNPFAFAFANVLYSALLPLYGIMFTNIYKFLVKTNISDIISNEFTEQN